MTDTVTAPDPAVEPSELPPIDPAVRAAIVAALGPVDEQILGATRAARDLMDDGMTLDEVADVAERHLERYLRRRAREQRKALRRRVAAAPARIESPTARPRAAARERRAKPTTRTTSTPSSGTSPPSTGDPEPPSARASLERRRGRARDVAGPAPFERRSR